MPFRSKAQQRLFFALESKGELPEGTARRWAHETKSLKKLPEHVKDKRKDKKDMPPKEKVAVSEDWIRKHVQGYLNRPDAVKVRDLNRHGLDGSDYSGMRRLLDFKSRITERLQNHAAGQGSYPKSLSRALPVVNEHIRLLGFDSLLSYLNGLPKGEGDYITEKPLISKVSPYLAFGAGLLTPDNHFGKGLAAAAMLPAAGRSARADRLRYLGEKFTNHLTKELGGWEGESPQLRQQVKDSFGKMFTPSQMGISFGPESALHSGAYLAGQGVKGVGKWLVDKYKAHQQKKQQQLAQQSSPPSGEGQVSEPGSPSV